MKKIVIKLDEVMLKKKIRLNELAERIDLTESNLSILKTGKARAIRFSTLEALCKELNCQPGDILTFSEDSASNRVKKLILKELERNEDMALSALADAREEEAEKKGEKRISHQEAWK